MTVIAVRPRQVPATMAPKAQAARIVASGLTFSCQTWCEIRVCGDCTRADQTPSLWRASERPARCCMLSDQVQLPVQLVVTCSRATKDGRAASLTRCLSPDASTRKYRAATALACPSGLAEFCAHQCPQQATISPTEHARSVSVSPASTGPTAVALVASLLHKDARSGHTSRL